MSIKNAGSIIREARLEAGLSLEKFSEGICSVNTLSRIELDKAGVGSAIFGALMKRAGQTATMFPVFEDYEDFKCYMNLSRARFYLNAWKLSEAERELARLKDCWWKYNRLYYQEWMLIFGMLCFRSYTCNHEYILNVLLDGLYVTRPNIDLKDISGLFLTVTEVELLLAIMQELLYLGDDEVFLSLHGQLMTYIKDHNFDSSELERIQSSYSLCHLKYLIKEGRYDEAYRFGEEREEIIRRSVNQLPVAEVHFLMAVCLNRMGKHESAMRMGKDCFYGSHAIRSVYANVCRDYMAKEFSQSLEDDILSAPEIKSYVVDCTELPDKPEFREEVISWSDSFTFGKLIRTLREEQGVTANMLCRGLCSKSALSKIENDKMKPDLILAECLLQKLGISEREFVFFGSKNDAIYYDLKMKLIRQSYLSYEERENCFRDFEKLGLEKNKLYKQFYLYEKSAMITDKEQRLNLLLEALSITLPDFDIYKLADYRLTWTEQGIINAIITAYRYHTQPENRVLWRRKHIEYHHTVYMDIILETRIFSITYAHFAKDLYVWKYYQELVDSINDIKNNVLEYQFNAAYFYYFCYCQALGEVKRADEIPLYAKYCYATKNLVKIGFDDTGELLLGWIFRDFGIKIVY